MRKRWRPLCSVNVQFSCAKQTSCPVESNQFCRIPLSGCSPKGAPCSLLRLSPLRLRLRTRTRTRRPLITNSQLSGPFKTIHLRRAQLGSGRSSGRAFAFRADVGDKSRSQSKRVSCPLIVAHKHSCAMSRGIPLVYGCRVSGESAALRNIIFVHVFYKRTLAGNCVEK